MASCQFFSIMTIMKVKQNNFFLFFFILQKQSNGVKRFNFCLWITIMSLKLWDNEFVEQEKCRQNSFAALPFKCDILDTLQSKLTIATKLPTGIVLPPLLNQKTEQFKNVDVPLG